MFTPSTSKIKKIATKNQEVISQLEKLLIGKFNNYIDYANVLHWSNKLKWHIDTKRLMQFLKSFDNVGQTKFYVGELLGDEKSKEFIKKITHEHYDVRSKPVKIMNLAIDATSIPKQSASLLNNFIKSGLIRLYNVATIE